MVCVHKAHVKSMFIVSCNVVVNVSGVVSVALFVLFYSGRVNKQTLRCNEKDTT